MKKHKWNRVTIVCIILILTVLLTGCITIESASPPNQPSAMPDKGSSTPPAASQANNLPEIMSFSADPAEVSSGEEATLSWDVAKADSVNIEPKIGYVDASGSIIITPEKNTVSGKFTQITVWSPQAARASSMGKSEMGGGV